MNGLLYLVFTQKYGLILWQNLAKYVWRWAVWFITVTLLQ